MERIDTALILSPDAKMMMRSSVLGTGGWLPPEEREVLDWITLIRLMGWRVQLKDTEEFRPRIIEDFDVKWVILAADPDCVESQIWDQIFLAVRTNPILFISQAGSYGSWYAKYTGTYISEVGCSGNLLQWKGNGSRDYWRCRNKIQLPVLNYGADSQVLASLAGNALVAAQKTGCGKMIALSFHPSKVRDLEGAFTALLKHLLVWESVAPVAWYDWEHTLILRMDDPGSSEVIYNHVYKNTKLGGQEWSFIGKELKKRQGRMSLGYVSGWVDDGDAARGELKVGGVSCFRTKGAIHPTPLVQYKAIENNTKNQIYDFEAEYRSIQKLRSDGLVDVELHGYTHLHPDRGAWVNATDRYINTSWYREFGQQTLQFIKSRPDLEHPLQSGIKTFSNYFQIFPTTLICPGDEYTNEVLEKALLAGLMMVSSYYLAIRIGSQLCWIQHVCAPYLDKPDSAWFDSELPVVGYFHDFDISINGTSWFSKYLDDWQLAGAEHIMDFRDVAAHMSYYLSIENKNNLWQLNMEAENRKPVIRPANVRVHIPDQELTNELLLRRNGEQFMVSVSKITKHIGNIVIPSTPCKAGKSACKDKF